MFYGMRARSNVQFSEIAPRVLTDIVLTIVSFFVAVATRYLAILLETKNPAEQLAAFNALWNRFVVNLAPVVIISILVFAFFGFYTKGRAYRGKYKIIIIVQAVAVAVLLSNMFTYFFLYRYLLARGVTLMFGGFLLLTVGGVRVAKTIFLRFYSITPQRGDIKKEVERVLVVGGAGYIGSVLCRLLLEKGYEVRVLDMLMFGGGALQEFIPNPKFKLIKGDFRAITNLVTAAKDVDVVIHMGAIVGDPACAIDSDYTIDVNYIATRMICDTCKGLGVRRFVFSSTCSVYGASDQLLDERSSLNPVSLYARTKIDSERAILAKKDASFSPTILRLATVFGLSPRPRFDLVVNLVAAMAVVDGSFKIFGGEQWRPFLHVEDAARAFIAAIEAPKEIVAGEIFNVGSDKMNYQLKELGDLVEKLVPNSRCERIEENVDKRNYKVSFAKIKNHLGYETKRTLEDGIAEIRDALASGKISDFRDRYFNNYHYLQIIKESSKDPAFEPLQYLATPGALSSMEDEFARKALLGDVPKPGEKHDEPKIKIITDNLG
ncbi:MAG: hypothetical protein Kow0090_05990 [Myxococcota bacterium]